ncbi:hypothetical protein B0J11DRAFT_570457 [Dendryphion nanum]|uniref:DNA repair protein REV1 n=1 Tax=Dendryphion nanum TaxID=256645 RepID=A0A9P9DGJ5_9PLEO|nr:hypothetical protein B0J11DRAFT_570457 [Dendryphion nanum]
MGSRLEANSSSVRKRIANHTFEDETGEEYDGSKFGGLSDYFRRKKIKLQNLDADIRSHSADKPAIFKGIVAHVNGYTQPSLNDLHILIVQHGGGFMQYLDGKTTVTHIIASNLTPKKAVEFKRYRIVKPAWIVDSVKAGKLLPWNEYRVVDEGEKQKVLAFDGGKVLTQTNVVNKGYRDQTENSWYTNQLRSGQPAPPTSTPSSSSKSRFTRQRLPTPEDDIEDLPPSHQIETSSHRSTSPDNITGPPQSKELVTPPKSSPSLGPQKDSEPDGGQLDRVEDAHDDLYDGPAPPWISSAQPLSKLGKEHTLCNPRDSEVLQTPNKIQLLTAEEHNAILLQDPKIRKSTVVDPNFLEQYYRESRLHHLSTWKADLKSQLQTLASEKSSSQKAKQRRPPGSRRYVLHVDFDSFFAAVSLKKHPEYVDKPAVVAHGNGSGSEIASCNYPARKFGIKNGMWMKRAQDLCPDLKVLPYDFPAYEQTSRAFYDAILATDGTVQSVSIDEALVDISMICISAGGSDGKGMSEGSIYREQAKANEIAQFIRNQVKLKTGCNVSVGIGNNILLAKVALRKAKPAGQHQIKPEEVLDFIGQLQVQDLPGVAGSIGGKLEEIGIKCVKDIRESSKERLIQVLGPKTGEKLWEYSRGIDKAEVSEQVVRKSVSAEVNWGVRFENQEQADEFIGNLCGELQKRLLKEKVKGKQFTMKIMRRSPDAPLDPPKHLGHGKCDTFNKSLVLGVATNSKDILVKEALSILKGFGFSPGELRGIGVQMTKLEPMKSATDGSLGGSQRRLQFRVGNVEPVSAHKSPKPAEEDPIQDGPETPKKSRGIEGGGQIAFGAHQLNVSTPSRRPLNTLGTQFIIPTQVDPTVLAELPEDIRSKLVRATRQSSPTPRPRAAKANESSLYHNSPFTRSANAPVHPPPFAMTALPAASQLDPEILANLPPDVRAEVLSQYAAGLIPTSPSASPSRLNKQKQTLLPQSPRKNRLIGIPLSKPIPIKRGRGRPPRSAQLAASAALPAKDTQGRTLQQSSFISARNPVRQLSPQVAVPVTKETDSIVDHPSLDSSFLSALPPDVRAEVIADHEAIQELALVTNSRHNTPPPTLDDSTPVLRIPRPPRPSFTGSTFTSETDLRKTLSQWIAEFWDEGPYAEDTAVLVGYLERVVREELDLGKACRCVKWMGWVVGGRGGGDVWEGVVRGVREEVSRVAGERGLGRVSFE